MIRFRRLFELTSDLERSRFAQAAEVFRAAFPQEADAIDRIAHMLLNRQSIGFDPIFMLSTDARDRITGLAFVYYFSDLNFGYLQYIASDPRKPARGIGVALYEALRELLAARGARGLFLDVPPTDPSKLKDPSRLATNRKRMRFYSSYDVQKVVGTQWDVEPNPRNEGHLTTLLYDPLGRRPYLRQRDAREVVRRILVEQYAFNADDPFVRRIVRSFSDQPVKLEPLAPQAERAVTNARQVRAADQNGRRGASPNSSPAREGLCRAPGACGRHLERPRGPSNRTRSHAPLRRGEPDSGAYPGARLLSQGHEPAAR